MFNLLGSGLYFMVALTALLAAVMVRGDRAGDRIHWLGIAALFIGFAASRWFQIEVGLSSMLRETIRSAGAYGERASWQAPATVVLVVLLFALGWYFIATWRRRSPGSRARAVFISRFAGIALLLFVGVRIASLHAIDKLIYSGGPIRLNYLIDLGLTGIVLAMAILYAYRSWQRRGGGNRRSLRR